MIHEAVLKMAEQVYVDPEDQDALDYLHNNDPVK